MDDILFEIGDEANPFYIDFQFKLLKVIYMAPYTVWIPDIHHLNVNESNYSSCGPLMKYIPMNCERSFINLVIVWTNIPQKIDPSLITLNKLNTYIK